PSYFFHPTLVIDSKKVFLHIPLDDLLSDKIPKLEGYMKIPDDLKMETSFPISTYIAYEEIFIKRSYTIHKSGEVNINISFRYNHYTGKKPNYQDIINFMSDNARR